MKTLRQRWQPWWAAIQYWIVGRWCTAPAAPLKSRVDETIAALPNAPASALLIQLASHTGRDSDTRHRCRTTISARAWHGEQRVIDLLTYHAARQAGDLTPTQMRRRLNNICSHPPD